ncbi:hypothetical protein K3495_g12468 [Podosphaera aphanis]|nr:hypothetical protein K3495_g12468 [Podosphaera aphanis]
MNMDGINQLDETRIATLANTINQIGSQEDKSSSDKDDEDISAKLREIGLKISDFEGPFREVCFRILDEDFVAWGFVVIKAWGYTVHGQAFENYWGRIHEFKKELLREKGLRGDLETGLASILRWDLFEDESLNFATPAQVRKKFEEIVEDEVACKSGVDVDIALMINRESVRSLMAPSPGTPPFIIGVVRSIGEENLGMGCFKIPIDALVPELWLLLANRTPISEIYPGDGEFYRGLRNRVYLK